MNSSSFRYPLEMHIVHTLLSFAGNTTEATDPEECFEDGAYCGLTVVGILFHIGSENNTVMDVSYIFLKTSYSSIITSLESILTAICRSSFRNWS